MLLWGLISIFGLVVGHLTVQSAFEFQLFEKAKLLSMQFVMSLFILCINLSLRSHMYVQLFCIFFCVLVPWIVLCALLYHRRGQFRPMTIEILDAVMVRMRSGHALKESFMWAVSFKPLWIQKVYIDFLQASQFKTNILADQQMSWVFSEIEKINQTKHKQIERFRNMRRKLKIEENFRRKSRKALTQVHAQAWVLSIMYVVLLLITIKFNAAKNLKGVIALSTTLFAVGLLFLLRIGKNYKWKL